MRKYVIYYSHSKERETPDTKGKKEMKTYIVNMNGKRSVTRPNMTYGKGFAIYVDDMGFLSLDGKNVYIPCGGRRVLKALLESGIENRGYYFIYQ